MSRSGAVSHFWGIDIGSPVGDAVRIDADGQVSASAVVPTGAKNRETIVRATDGVFRRTGSTGRP